MQSLSKTYHKIILICTFILIISLKFICPGGSSPLGKEQIWWHVSCAFKYSRNAGHGHLPKSVCSFLYLCIALIRMVGKNWCSSLNTEGAALSQDLSAFWSFSLEHSAPRWHSGVCSNGIVSTRPCLELCPLELSPSHLALTLFSAPFLCLTFITVPLVCLGALFGPCFCPSSHTNV